MNKKDDVRKKNQRASKLGKSSLSNLNFERLLLTIITNTTEAKVNQWEFEEKGKGKTKASLKLGTTMVCNGFFPTEQFTIKIRA